MKGFTGYEVISIGRSKIKSGNKHYNFQLEDTVDYGNVFEKCDVLIHTAALVHSMVHKPSESLNEFRAVNVSGTLNLARQAADSGVKRFIFISTIKVNGEQTFLGHPFTADDIPRPEDSYAISKLESELGLQDLAVSSGMEVIIIRPPLVYGPGVKGNFASMINLVKKGVPLPLGAVFNKRTLISIDNLIDLVVTCIDHPAAANQVFLAGDGEDLSTSDLLRGIARAMGKPSRLIPFPESFLRLSATLIGKKALADRLLDSLQVDISKARDLLGWEPPLSVEEGLKRCFEAENNR